MCRRFKLRYTFHRCGSTCGDADELQPSLKSATQKCGREKSSACRKAKNEIIEVPFGCWHHVEEYVKHSFRDLWKAWLQVPRQYFYQSRWQTISKMDTLHPSVQDCLKTFFKRSLADFRRAHLVYVKEFVQEYIRCHPTEPEPQILYEWIDLANIFGERIQLAKIHFNDNAVVEYKTPLAEQPRLFKDFFQLTWSPTVRFIPLVPTQHDEPEPPRPLPAQGQGLAPEPGWDIPMYGNSTSGGTTAAPGGPASPQVPVTTAAGSSTAGSEQQQYWLSHYGADQGPAVTYSQYSSAPTASGGYPGYHSGHHHPPASQNPYGSYYGGQGPAPTPISDAGQADTQGSSTAAASGYADPDVERRGYPWDNPYGSGSS